jgi:hypothetical protein
VTNRISKYDAIEWLRLLVEQRLIDYGEPVVAAHEAMRNSPDICEFEEEHEQ